MSKVKYLPSSVGERFNLSRFPNFHKSGSVSGMKKLYYGKDALLEIISIMSVQNLTSIIRYRFCI